MSPASRRNVKAQQADAMAKKQSWMVAGDELPPSKEELEKNKRKGKKRQKKRTSSSRIREDHPISEDRQKDGWRQ